MIKAFEFIEQTYSKNSHRKGIISGVLFDWFVRIQDFHNIQQQHIFMFGPIQSS